MEKVFCNFYGTPAADHENASLSLISRFFPDISGSFSFLTFICIYAIIFPENVREEHIWNCNGRP